MPTPPPLSPSPPPHLLDADGTPLLGAWRYPLADVDLEDASVPTGRLGKLRLPPTLGRLRLKQWQHFALVNPRLVLTFAVVDVGYLRTSWCQVFDRVRGTRVEHERRLLRGDVRVARSLWDDETHFRAPGYRVEIRNQLQAKRHVATLEADAHSGQPALRAHIHMSHDPRRDEPLVVSLPVGRGRVMYSHKAVIPAEGTVRVGPETYALSAADTHAIVDVHKAHYPHHTWWRWATFATRLPDGRSLGLNLTHNLVEDADIYNENVVWLDGRAHRLPGALFEFDPSAAEEPWHVGTRDSAVVLTFRPRGRRSEDLTAGPIRSRFKQLYGVFDGTIQLPHERLDVRGAAGLAEDHDSLW